MPLILGTNSIKDTGYDVANSLRFSPPSSTGLELDLGTPTNAKKYTISFWVKRDVISASGEVIAGGTNGSNETFIRMNSNGQFQLKADHGSATSWAVTPNALGRDPSAWYNYILAVDTSQGTASNRVKIYLNGELQSLSTANYPDQDDAVGFLNNDNVIHIGKRNYDDAVYFGGYLCEFVFLDGQTLDATSFGEFDSDSGIWKPIDVSGLTFGNNGFYLEFKQSGTSQNSSGLGADTSGNDNHFAVENLTGVNQSTDTCTNNFATLNPLHKVDDWSLAEGNLKFTNNSTGHRMTNSNIAVSQGKWYCEVKMTTEAQQTRVGIIDPDKFSYNTYIHNAGRGYAYKGEDGSTRFNDGTTDANYGDTYTTGDIIGIAMDLDNHKLYFSKNGTFQDSGDPTSGATGTGSAFDLATGVFYSFGASTFDEGTDPVIEFNFGNPSFSISSGNTDGNGYGNFEYAVPNGYYSLNSKNLAEYG
jgi:hypothetical protein